MYTSFVFLISLSVTFLVIKATAPRLRQQELTGQDLNKPDNPVVPEMGGLAITFGFASGILLVIGLQTFLNVFQGVEPVPILMALLTTFIVAQVGIMDDLIEVRQLVKATVPLFASLPLVLIKAGQTAMGIPFLGRVEFGIVYPLLLVPVGVTGAANAVNMLAGFNGLEVGMGVIAVGSLGIIAYFLHAGTAFLLLTAAFGALLATLYFNWYPVKILIGDVGTFSIGAIIASAVILGNFEVAGAIIIIPYLFDFAIKAFHGFPSRHWWGEYQKGKLHCPEEGPLGLAHIVMKITGGIKERNLVLALMGLEGLCGLTAILFYLQF